MFSPERKISIESAVFPVSYTHLDVYKRQVQASEIDFGPNGYVLSYGDAAAVAKAIRDFSKEKGNEALVIKGAILGGQQLLSKEQVFALAALPSKATLIAQVVGTIAAPLRGLVTAVSYTHLERQT